MPRASQHIEAIKETIAAAISDRALSREQLREVLEAVTDECDTISAGLDSDDAADLDDDEDEET